MKIYGFVTPRFLDSDWYRNFTVHRERRKEVDIPVEIIVDVQAYEASKFTNNMPSYGELLEEVGLLKAEIKGFNAR